MDETKYVAVPIPADDRMKAAAQWLITKGNLTVNYCVEANMNADKIYSAMLAAAPTTHVAVKRELLKRTEELLGQALKHLCDHENELPVSYEVLAELRTLLSQKGE